MTKWCLLLVIISVMETSHQFPYSEKGLYHNASSEEIAERTLFHQCQDILRQIIDRLENEEDIHRLLQETGARVDRWSYEKELLGSSRTCRSESETTHQVHFIWNSGQNDCVNLTVFNDNGIPNFNENICDLNTNSSIVPRGLIKNSAKTKRSLTRQVIHSYVNLAREIESTECSSPTLNVYFNNTLVFSNASKAVGIDVNPMDTIEVHINVNCSRFYNSVPAMKKKVYSIHTNPSTFYKAFGDCSRQSKELVSIESVEETNEVVAAMNKNQILKCWTSGHRLGPNHWHWHGSGSIKDYTNWDVLQPNNNGKGDYCLNIKQQGGAWSDQDCSTKLPFICQSTSVTEAVEVPPTVNIFIDENLEYDIQPAPEYKKDQSNVVEVKIGLNGNAGKEHPTKFLVLKKNSPKEATSEQKLVTPKNSINSEFNGIDIRIEHIQQKGLSCQKEKIYHVHTEEKLNYTDAQKFCKKHSSQLVSIQNEMQHLDIQKIMLNLNIHHYYWTSGYLAADGATWLWNENEAVTYFNWAKEEPDNIGSSEKCIEIFVAGKTVKWNDQECEDKNLIICESYTEPYWRREKH